LVNERLTQAYRNVTLFGITVSTNRFPFAVLAFVGAALLGTIVTLRTAKRRRIALLDQLAEVHGLDCWTVRSPLLLLVWLVLPLTALGAALPLVPLSRVETIYLFSGAGGVALMGLNCVVLAFATHAAK
jgi:hypothetical protein